MRQHRINGKGISKSKLYATAVGVWFIFLIIAFSLGTLRELLITPLIGEGGAHVVGTLAVVAAFLGLIVVFVRRFQNHCSTGVFWLIGLLWLLMTASFEFLFFHFVGGKSWAKLWADYDVTKGRIWVLVLATTLLGPPVIHSILEKPSNRVILIRVIHSALAAVFLIGLLHIYASALTGHLTPWLFLSVGLLLLDGFVLSVNSCDCPLSSLQRKYGDEKGFFGLFLPSRLLPFITPFFATLTLIGLLLLTIAFLRS